MNRVGPAERKILRDAFANFPPEAIVALHDTVLDEVDRRRQEAEELRDNASGSPNIPLGLQAQIEGRAYQLEIDANRLGALVCEITGIEMPQIKK